MARFFLLLAANQEPASMLNDLRLAVRSLLRQPGFSLLAILTLALGIGAAAAIFSVVDAVVLRPMPYPSGDRMRYVWLKAPEGMGGFMVTPSLALARDVLLPAVSFERIEIYEGESRVIPGPDGAEAVDVLHARPPLFAMLGARPRIGRALVEDDMRPDAPDVAVLTHEFWTDQYGGAADVLDQDVRLDGRPHRIIGVMGAGFRVPDGRHRVIVPLRSDPQRPDAARRVTMLGVLREGTSTAAASSELEGLAGGAGDRDSVLGRGFVPAAIEPGTFVSRTMRRSSLVLFGAVGLLLLIGCANVAALLVTRNAARAREVAIRRALGAGRGRLVRLLLLEALALAACAGTSGILIAWWLLDLARAVVPARLVPVEALHMDGVVLGFTVGVSLLTALAFGILPALQGSRVDLTAAMRADARSGNATRSRQLTRRVLTAAEIALAVVLLVGAGLLARTFTQMQRIPLGFEPRGTLSASFALPETRYADDEAQRQFFERLAEAARALPGVVAVARATGLPPESGLLFGEMRIEGRSGEDTQGPGAVSGSTVSDEYFTLMRIPLRRGRTFGSQDVREGERVAVINETMARRVFPGDDAIGRRFTFGRGPSARWVTIVGIVGDVKAAGLRTAGHGDYQVYYSTRQSDSAFGSIVVRTEGDPAVLGPLVRGRVTALDPMLPAESIVTGEERVAVQLAGERFNALLVGMFAAVGLLLAGTGIYGMMGLYVAQRRHELGVRLALGATPRVVRRLVLRQMAAIAAAGLAAGVGAALLTTRLMTSLLYEVPATDIPTFATVVVVIAAVSLVATVVPVRRALRIEPAAALRSE